MYIFNFTRWSVPIYFPRVLSFFVTDAQYSTKIVDTNFFFHSLLHWLDIIWWVKPILNRKYFTWDDYSSRAFESLEGSLGDFGSFNQWQESGWLLPLLLFIFSWDDETKPGGLGISGPLQVSDRTWHVGPSLLQPHPSQTSSYRIQHLVPPAT